MKNLLKVLSGVILMLSGNLAMATKLQVSVTGIDVKKGGDIVVFIYTTAKGFPKVHREASIKKVKKASATRLLFQINIPEQVNELAIKVLHDRNSDGKVTKNWTGIIPKDGLGFSNKQKLLSIKGLPSFNNTKISKQMMSKVQGINISYYAN